MRTKETVHSHSYQHFDDLQMSAKEFYNSIAEQLDEYKYPQVGCSSREISQYGPLSARREYLCIHRYDLEFMVCAAPFGRSFFISWWMAEKRDPLVAFLKRVPLIGLLFAGEPSYYEIDTALVFSNSIDAIVKAAVERVKAEHGFRQLAAGAEARPE